MLRSYVAGREPAVFEWPYNEITENVEGQSRLFAGKKAVGFIK